MLYRVIGVLVLVIVLGSVFDLGDPIKTLVSRIADVPTFTDRGTNPALFDLAVRLAYLIAIVGVLKLFLSSRRRDDDQ